MSTAVALVPWIALAGLIVATRVAARSQPRRLDALERHLMRCRRREEPASVLVARLDRRSRPAEGDVLACFRLTDSVAVRRIGQRLELLGVFDDDRLDRSGVERRLRATASRAGVELAWARFPEDGVTLEVLLDAARAALPAQHRAMAPAEAGALPPAVASGAEVE
jgi:hypothetical protein